MQPETDDESYPLFGKISTPRMIVAQFDNMNLVGSLEPRMARVLGGLEAMIYQKNARVWFTIFVSVFILLHEVSVASKDRCRHGTANSAGVSPGHTKSLA